MQTVTFFSDVEHTTGALGYSVLQAGFFGAAPSRMTLLFLRDGEGFAKSTVIAPAETLREVIY